MGARGRFARFGAVRRKPDANHVEIASAMASAGRLVADLSSAGKGVLDLLVMRSDGQLRLMEIKTADGKLEDAQVKFIEKWPHVCVVVRTRDEALAAVGIGNEERKAVR